MGPGDNICQCPLSSPLSRHFPGHECNHMKRFLIISTLSLLGMPVMAADFIGKWAVSTVEYPENYYGEIKYPKYFELLMMDGRLVGFYKDQFDYECKFPLADSVNGGEELLLMVCGTTKSTQSWAPLNKVKLIDGELVGSVVTYDRRFTWRARRVQSVPLTISPDHPPAPLAE